MSEVQQATPTLALTAKEQRDTQIASALRRDRAVKEQKLAAQRRMEAFQAEETSVFEANVKEARQLYEQQLVEQRLVDDRQREAATDILAAEARKRELVAMVSKIAAIKHHITQQDLARERELDFRAKQMQKREAFEKRSKTIEQTQVSERDNLVTTQDRVARNLKTIHSLEMRGLSDNDKKGRAREYELQYQQLKMKQQKEAEQLRELQLIKIRHMSESMEAELLAAAELEGLISDQKLREDALEAEQVLERAAEATKLDRQQAQLKALQLKEEQKLAKASLLQNQNRQRKMLDRGQRSSARQRERAIQDETSTLMAEVGLGMIAAGDGSALGTSERDTSEAYELQSSHAGVSEMDQSEGFSHEGEHELTEEEIQAMVQGSGEADRKRKQRNTNDAAAELLEALSKGVERLKNLEQHHKKILESMRSQHKDQREQKMRELKRKQAQLIKDQEDEVQNVRTEQATDMEELFETIRQAQELFQDQETKFVHSSAMAVTGNLMPSYFAAGLKTGYTPQPVAFENAVMLRTAVAGIKELAPKQIVLLLQRMYAAFDDVIAKCPDVFKVESVGDSYILCAGFNEPTMDIDKTSEDLTSDCLSAVECALTLMHRAGELDVSDLNVPGNKLLLKVGIQQGPVKAGLVGVRMPQFRVLGDTVDRAAKLCAAAEPAGILVSKQVHDLLGDRFIFEKHGESGASWLKEKNE